MPNSKILSASKGCVLVFLGLFFAHTTLTGQSKQTSKTTPNLATILAGLPQKDANYLIQSDAQMNVYAVKQGGKIIDYIVTDKSGNLYPSEKREVPESATGTQGERKRVPTCYKCFHILVDWCWEIDCDL